MVSAPGLPSPGPDGSSTSRAVGVTGLSSFLPWPIFTPLHSHALFSFIYTPIFPLLGGTLGLGCRQQYRGVPQSPPIRAQSQWLSSPGDTAAATVTRVLPSGARVHPPSGHWEFWQKARDSHSSLPGGHRPAPHWRVGEPWGGGGRAEGSGRRARREGALTAWPAQNPQRHQATGNDPIEQSLKTEM